MLASASFDETIRLWDPRSGKLLHELKGEFSGWVNKVAFDPQGSILASCGNDRTVRLWKASSGKLLHTLEGHSQRVCCVAFDPVNPRLASGGGDNTVKIWEAPSGKLLRTLSLPSPQVPNLAFSPDDKTVYVTALDQIDKSPYLGKIYSIPNQ